MTSTILDVQSTIIDTNAIQTLEEMINQSKMMSLICQDEATENMWLDDSLKLHYLTYGKEKSVNMSKWSFSQLCSKIGVPVKYMFKCIQNGYNEMVQENMNVWLKELQAQKRKSVIRKYYSDKYGEYVRAVVSDKYSTFDTAQVLTSIKKNVNLDNYDIRGSVLTPEKMHLRLTNKEKLNVKDVGDIFSGIMISNSEVGQGALNIAFMMYRLQCTNGMVMTTEAPIVYCRHYGNTIENFSNKLSGLPQILEKAEEKMANLIKLNLEKKYSVAEVQTYFEKMKKELKLSQENLDVLKSLQFGYSQEMGNNNFAVVNALTDFSKKFEIDKRVEIETYAGKMFAAA